MRNRASPVFGSLVAVATDTNLRSKTLLHSLNINKLKYGDSNHKEDYVTSRGDSVGFELTRDSRVKIVSRLEKGLGRICLIN